MDEAKTLRAAIEAGFDLEQRITTNTWVWGWSRGEDERWPCYLTRAEALRWMEDRIAKVRVFS